MSSSCDTTKAYGECRSASRRSAVVGLGSGAKEEETRKRNDSDHGEGVVLLHASVWSVSNALLESDGPGQVVKTRGLQVIRAVVTKQSNLIGKMAADCGLSLERRRIVQGCPARIPERAIGCYCTK
jgi:hypothetical protein